MAGPFNLLARFKLFRTRKKMRGEQVRRYTVSNPYHAVSVQGSPGCCRVAQEHAGKRFLSAEAPGLPLAGCDASTCKCRYLHHADRRKGSRRHSDLTQQRMGFWRGEERRIESGRRVTDL